MDVPQELLRLKEKYISSKPSIIHDPFGLQSEGGCLLKISKLAHLDMKECFDRKISIYTNIDFIYDSFDMYAEPKIKDDGFYYLYIAKKD